jgi:hypothetical protein
MPSSSRFLLWFASRLRYVRDSFSIPNTTPVRKRAQHQTSGPAASRVIFGHEAFVLTPMLHRELEPSPCPPSIITISKKGIAMLSRFRNEFYLPLPSNAAVSGPDALDRFPR